MSDSPIMKDKVLAWFIYGETGISSEAMACAVSGMMPNPKGTHFGNHPHDPDDLNRCIKFLDAVPEARDHLDKVAVLSKTWAALVGNWSELEALLREEVPTGIGRAPKTYARMKQLGC